MPYGKESPISHEYCLRWVVEVSDYTDQLAWEIEVLDRDKALAVARDQEERGKERGHSMHVEIHEIRDTKIHASTHME